MYDKRGNLVKLEKSTYYTDRSVAYLAFGEEWFSTCPEEFKYNRKVLQLKADDYYFDYEKLGKFYSEQEKVMLIAGKGTTQPYYFDPVDLFYNNISPRVGFSNHVLNYQLVYGGKTLLNRTRKYLFTGIISTGPSITHLTGNLPSGNYCTEDVEYRYDNPGKHANPTRTIYHDTRGNEQVVVRRSPLDFTGEADLVINEMVSAHYIAPVIKEQRLFRAKNSGQYTIIEESHTEYQKRTNASGENIFLPCKANIYTFHAPATIDTLFPKLDNKLYSRSDTACVQRKNTTYRQLGNKYLPVEGLDQGSRTICCYDQERHNLILKAQDVLNDQVDAVDRYRVSLIGDAQTLKNKDLCGLTLPRKLSVVPRGVTAYRLFLLVKPDVSSLNVPCIQKYTNGTTTPRSLSISVSPGIWQLVTCDLTIPNNTSSLEIDLSGFNSIALSVLAPQNTIFEGYSFDQIGRKFGTLNQQGQLERYDYDPLGRVTRVWDGKSNLLKELKYRIIL